MSKLPFKKNSIHSKTKKKVSMTLDLEELKKKEEELRNEITYILNLQNEINSLNHNLQKTEDIFEKDKYFHKCLINGSEIIVRGYTRGVLPDAFSDWVFDLEKRNMEEIYRNAWGWNEEAKRQEMYELEDSIYLIATFSETPIAFVHFKFEEQNQQQVLFIYDIQVEEQFQRKRLGKHLVLACWTLASMHSAACVMTMVFKNNTAALAFFKASNFHPHELSPEIIHPEKESNYKHVILFRKLGKVKNQPNL